MKNLLYHLLQLAACWGGIAGQREAVKNCPKSCYCELSTSRYAIQLTIRDCVTEPGSRLYKLLQEHRDIWQLQIINASLSSIGDVSYLYQLWGLDLRYNYLTSLPCELSNLPTLSVLDLSHNAIQTVDCDMSELKALNDLNLDYNKLKSMPCELSNVPALYELHLSHNHIQKVDCDMSELKEFNYLHLDYNKLKSVPCELSKLSTLSFLNISHNSIQTVDCGMSEFKGDLYLDYNKLKSLPCELSKSSILSFLSLSHNDIQTVECDMSELKELDYLYLDYNRLKSVPCELAKLSTVSFLHLSHNDIQTVHCDMAEFKGYLYPDYNKLKSVPCELSNITGRVGLSLSHNDIETIDCAFTQLWELDLSYNKLTDLPLLKGKQRVIISNNAVSHFTNKAGLNVSCEELPTYYLQYNNISHLMNIFVGWGISISETTELGVCIDKITEHFSGNPLICDCKDYRLYHFLQVNQKVWNYTCSSPLILKGQNPVRVPLDQFACNLTEKCPVGCSCVSVPGAQALRVSCKAYKGVVLPKDMPALPKGSFYEFELSESHLTSLTVRSYFTNTTKAIFSHSFISEITMATLKALAENIKVIHLNNNRLKSLPADISRVNFKSLVEIRFDNNPWDCSDCRTLGLRDLVMQNYHIMKNPDLIKCHSPPEVQNMRVTYLARSYFCHREARNNTFSISVTATTGTILLIVSVATCIKKRKKVKEGVPVPQQNRGVIDNEAEDEGRLFDIFVSYATDDEEYAGEWLIPELESRGFKVCFHRVHFLGGVPIHVNMHQCIIKSKRTLAFFSRNFLESNYCTYEFELAQSIDINEGTRRLVTIKEATLNTNTLEPSYAVYFDTHTYIEQGAVNFWRNLLFTMPQNKLGKVAVPEGDENVV